MYFNCLIMAFHKSETYIKQYTDINIIVIGCLYFSFVFHISHRDIIHKDIFRKLVFTKLHGYIVHR